MRIILLILVAFTLSIVNAQENLKLNRSIRSEKLISISDTIDQVPQQQLRNIPPYDEYGRLNTIVTKNLKKIAVLQNESIKLKKDLSLVKESLKETNNTNKSLQKIIKSNTILIKSLKKDVLVKTNKNLLLEKKNIELKKDKINGSAISGLQIEIIKKPTTISKNKLTPNVIGLTETAARKILLNFGLKLDPIYQSINVKISKIKIGQSFKQEPNAGDEFGVSKIVTVFFAKKL